jgi:hypothetical protein
MAFNPLLIVGAIAIVAVLAVVAYTQVINKPGSSGSITFSPSTVSCSNPVAFTTTMNLPSSVKQDDQLRIYLDGKLATTQTISGDTGDNWTKQSDGSWVGVSTTTAEDMQTLCSAGGASGGFNILTVGTHTYEIRDASGKVLASGQYTVK